MKANKHVTAKVMCACYKYNTRSAIYCIAPEEAAGVVTTFCDPELRKHYMKRHCFPPDDSKRCVLYDNLFNNDGSGK